MRKTFWEGIVVEMFIAPTLDAPMQSIVEARLVPGRGIEGDRHYMYSERDHTEEEEDEPSYEVTLIESEAIVAVQEETRTQFAPDVLRRNIVTSGCSVSHLVQREFSIGDVRLRGLALYEPSTFLLEVVGHKVVIGLMHRGGLAAEIISQGVIRVGDTIHE